MKYPPAGTEATSKDAMVAAMEEVQRRERFRQSKRAVIVVGCLALFGLAMLALSIWINSTSH